MGEPDVSIILPVLNGIPYIREFHKRILHVLSHVSFTYELIYVENGSVDGSLQELRVFAKQRPIVRVIQSEKGWGNAVRAGLSAARGHLASYMVTDGQIDPLYIVSLYKLFKQNSVDLVKIRRISRENTYRMIQSRVYNTIAQLLLGYKTRDANATPKLFLLARINGLHLTSPNVALDAELLLKLDRSSGTWIEIDAKSGKRAGGISTTNFRSVLEMCRYLLQFRFRLGRATAAHRVQTPENVVR